VVVSARSHQSHQNGREHATPGSGMGGSAQARHGASHGATGRAAGGRGGRRGGRPWAFSRNVRPGRIKPRRTSRADSGPEALMTQCRGRAIRGQRHRNRGRRGWRRRHQGARPGRRESAPAEQTPKRTRDSSPRPRQSHQNAFVHVGRDMGIDNAGEASHGASHKPTEHVRASLEHGGGEHAERRTSTPPRTQQTHPAPHEEARGKRQTVAQVEDPSEANAKRGA
jgi:hypothetical protein